MLNQKPTPLIVALLAVGAITTLTTPASYAKTASTKATSVQEKVTYSPGRSISPQEEQVISSAASKILRHIAQARADIHNQDLESAKTQLGLANTLLDIIKTSLPTTEIKDRIWVAKKHLEYEDTLEVVPDLVPIYTSLNEVLDYMPVKEAKAHLDKARGHLKQGDKKAAVKELDATDASLMYTEIDLPFNTTRRLVANATADLEKADTKAADQSLKTAEDNVSFMTVGIAEPLVPAKSALWRATRDFAKGAYDGARNELGTAIRYLEQSADSTDSFVREETAKLLTQAHALEGKIAKGSDASKAQLDLLWQRTEALSDRAMHYISTGWSRLRNSDVVKADLIEAKLQLDFARIDQITAKDAPRATADLKQAVDYLVKASSQVSEDTPQKVEIRKLTNEIDLLRHTSHTQPSDSQYAKVSQDMRDVIESL
jgi:hypothetical protein